MEKVLALVLVVYVGSAKGLFELFQSEISADESCQTFHFQPYKDRAESDLYDLTKDSSFQIELNENEGNQFLLMTSHYRYTNDQYKEYYYLPIPQEMGPQVASKGSGLNSVGIPSLLVSTRDKVRMEYHMTLFDIAFITHSGNAASPPYVRVAIEFEPEEGVAGPPLAVFFFVYKGAEGDQINKHLSSFLNQFDPKKFPEKRIQKDDVLSDQIPVDLAMIRDALESATTDAQIYYTPVVPNKNRTTGKRPGFEFRYVLVGCQYVDIDVMQLYQTTVLSNAR